MASLSSALHSLVLSLSNASTLGGLCKREASRRTPLSQVAARSGYTNTHTHTHTHIIYSTHTNSKHPNRTKCNQHSCTCKHAHRCVLGHAGIQHSNNFMLTLTFPQIYVETNQNINNLLTSLLLFGWFLFV